MREDGRPQDSFSWVRPWVPYGDDPFVWHDPAEDMKSPSSVEQPRPPRAESRGPAPVSAATASSDDIWVELPASDDKPKRPRRARGRGRGRAEIETEVVAPVEALEVADVLEVTAPAEAAEQPEPVEAVAPAPPAKRARTRKTVVTAPVEMAPVEEAPAEPTIVAEETPPTPAAPREPDPAEIAGPPPAARKGWWRRG